MCTKAVAISSFALTLTTGSKISQIVLYSLFKYWNETKQQILHKRVEIKTNTDCDENVNVDLETIITRVMDNINYLQELLVNLHG